MQPYSFLLDLLRMGFTWTIAVTLGSHDLIDFSSDAGSVYKMDVTGTTQSGEKFTGHFKGLVGKDTRVFIELDENADVQVFIPQGEID